MGFAPGTYRKTKNSREGSTDYRQQAIFSENASYGRKIRKNQQATLPPKTPETLINTGFQGIPDVFYTALYGCIRTYTNVYSKIRTYQNV